MFERARIAELSSARTIQDKGVSVALLIQTLGEVFDPGFDVGGVVGALEGEFDCGFEEAEGGASVVAVDVEAAGVDGLTLDEHVDGVG
jgi:hypothetical protein